MAAFSVTGDHLEMFALSILGNGDGVIHWMKPASVTSNQESRGRRLTAKSKSCPNVHLLYVVSYWSFHAGLDLHVA
jgi:hypothetical protein